MKPLGSSWPGAAAARRGQSWAFWLAALVIASSLADTAIADDPLSMRIESFGVAPAHSPPAAVVIMNHGEKPFQGVVRIKLPDGWQLSPTEKEVALAPGESKRVAFMVKGGLIAESNRYRLVASVTGPDGTITHEQDVVAASAPYYKPTIDGATDDWDDAIPVTWTTGGKKTVLSTYWNRRRFALLVAVEEDKLIPFQAEPGPGGFDAVQLALSPQNTTTGTSPDDEATRYEFLFTSTGSGTDGKCFLLAEPGMKLSEGQTPRQLAPLEYEDAEIAVSRREGVTYYECSLPFRPMRDRIRPSEGREFHLSVLVHDPDGTGVRDWGQAAGLGSCQRNRLAWSLWPGAQWGDHPPFDNKTEWGLCSSKF